MLSFPIAYLVVWFGVLVYVLRLGAKHAPIVAKPGSIAKEDRGQVKGSGVRVQGFRIRIPTEILNREPLTVRGNKPPGLLICPLPPVPDP